MTALFAQRVECECFKRFVQINLQIEEAELDFKKRKFWKKWSFPFNGCTGEPEDKTRAQFGVFLCTYTGFEQHPMGTAHLTNTTSQASRGPRLKPKFLTTSAFI